MPRKITLAKARENGLSHYYTGKASAAYVGNMSNPTRGHHMTTKAKAAKAKAKGAARLPPLTPAEKRKMTREHNEHVLTLTNTALMDAERKARKAASR